MKDKLASLLDKTQLEGSAPKVILNVKFWTNTKHSNMGRQKIARLQSNSKASSSSSNSNKLHTKQFNKGRQRSEHLQSKFQKKINVSDEEFSSNSDTSSSSNASSSIDAFSSSLSSNNESKKIQTQKIM